VRSPTKQHLKLLVLARLSSIRSDLLCEPAKEIDLVGEGSQIVSS
jgi:hypothetical protein